jgi:hypothetical protein
MREQTAREYPESWIPTEEDPVIAGEFLRLEHGHTAYGAQDIVVVRTEDGRERSVWLLHEVLKNQLVRIAPKPGELLCIRWKGKRTSGGGNEYDDYRVDVDRQGEGPDWSAVAGAPPVDRDSVREIDMSDGRSLEHLPERERQRAARDDEAPF